MNRLYLIVGATSVVSFAAGGAATFFFVKDKLRKHYEDIATAEIAEAKEFYTRLYKAESFETPEEAVEKLIPEAAEQNDFAADPRAVQAAQVLSSYGGHNLHKPPVAEVVKARIEETTITRNVFIEEEAKAQGITDPDWTAELMSRTEEAPYVLSKDEFMENESEYVQVTLTYYAGDRVLTDDRDDVIEDVDDTVGMYNLARFGQWSHDDHVVYVRNDVRENEFEITLNEGRYSVLVQGMTE